MSVIQNIRTKYAKLAGGVIAVALVAFILMDALSSRVNNLFGNDTSVVTVNGEEVEYVEYSRKIQNYETLYAANQELTDNLRTQIKEQSLSELVNNILVEEEAEKLGLTVTETEKKDMIYGPNPDQAVRSYQPFQNRETNRFDPQYVKLFEQQADQLDPTGKAGQHWEAMKNYIVNNSLTKKYNMMINAGVYLPMFMVKDKIDGQYEMASIDYVSVPYETINDEDVKVSDEEIKKYMKEHKEQYSNEYSTRSIEYVSFRVLPRAEDTARALGVLEEIKTDFANAKDNESFVNRNSEESYAGSYVMKANYRSFYADSIFNTSVGNVYGPYFENGSYKLVKVVDKKQYPDSVKCRHILIKTADRGQPIAADSTVKTRMDSVASAIKSGASFAQMVTQYSQDPGSVDKGGEYTFAFTQKSGLSKEFGDFIFNGKTGETKIVKVENSNYSGYHFIEILDQKNFKEALQLATITKALYAGDNTENDVYARAAEFASSNSTAEAFDKATEDPKVQKLVAENIKVSDFTIPGLANSREIIRWVYEAEVDEISSVFSVPGSYVVAKLTKVQPKGLKELNDELRNSISVVVKAEKKADMISEKYKSASSLQAIAQQSNQEVSTVDSFRRSSSFIGPIGYEPKVAGYAFYKGLDKNKISPAIAGQSGVYYISLKGRFQSAEARDSSMIKNQRIAEQGQVANTVSSQIGEALIKKSDVEYNGNNL